MTKKILIILLSIILILVLVGCSSPATNTTNQENESTEQKESNKQLYNEKLDTIESEVEKELSELYDSGVTAQMLGAANEEYKKWDNALTEITDVLKTQLSIKDINKLNEEQAQWIIDKNKKAKEESADVKGGSAEPVIYTCSIANSTKARCYELVESYME